MNRSEQRVPGNRWDLLTAAPPLPVAVVVTHFQQPAQLARTLQALQAQTRRPAEVLVADDGSARLPQVPPGVRLVTQPDLGFRAAAARNLGARCTTAPVLVFLDADTTPEPAYLEHLLRRVDACPDVLAVGRRRHADLSGNGAELPEPGWLQQGYRQSADLLHADGQSFRLVISAVLACRRALFDDIAGFDERFVGYGGEDWDLAYRAWNNGAVLVHERDAVAWHDGPDWAGRAQDPGQKKAEQDRLAALIPEPSTRGHGRNDLLPDLLHMRAPASWSQDQLRRARMQLHSAHDLDPGALAPAVAALIAQDLGEVRIRCEGALNARLVSTRAIGRARRWAHHPAADRLFAHRDYDLRARTWAPAG